MALIKRIINTAARSKRSSRLEPKLVQKFKVPSFKDRVGGELARFDNSQNVKRNADRGAGS